MSVYVCHSDKTFFIEKVLRCHVLQYYFFLQLCVFKWRLDHAPFKTETVHKNVIFLKSCSNNIENLDKLSTIILLRFLLKKD